MNTSSRRLAGWQWCCRHRPETGTLMMQLQMRLKWLSTLGYCITNCHGNAHIMRITFTAEAKQQVCMKRASRIQSNLEM